MHRGRLIRAAMTFSVVMLAVALVAMAAVLRGERDSVIRQDLLSPGGQYRLLLTHDTFLGQTETLLVTSHPGTARERDVLRSIGDEPIRFLRWRGANDAELDVAVAGAAQQRRMLLHCAGEHCSLTEDP